MLSNSYRLPLSYTLNTPSALILGLNESHYLRPDKPDNQLDEAHIEFNTWTP